jgi:hypothetical protein
VRCRDPTDSSFLAKVPGEVFSHFHIVAGKDHRPCGIHCLDIQDEFSVGSRWPFRANSLWTVRVMSHLFRLLGIGERGLFLWEDCCFGAITISPALVTYDNLHKVT